jgi:TRAP-type C4-dicarboxylate transport system permease small subunit
MLLIRPIDILLTVLACTTAGLVVGLITLEVIARYFFGSSIYFATELAQLMFVWTVFLGLPLALVRGRHVSITVADTMLPPAAAVLMRRLAMTACIVLLAVLVWKCWELMLFNWDQRLNTMRLSAGLYYLPVIVGAVTCIIIFAVGIAKGDYRLIHSEEEA